MSLEKDINSGIKGVKEAIRLIKAKGGYKFREEITYSDEDLDRKEEFAETMIIDMAVRVTVAEALLLQKPPHFHCRWQDYQQKLKEVTAKRREPR